MTPAEPRLYATRPSSPQAISAAFPGYRVSGRSQSRPTWPPAAGSFHSFPSRESASHCPSGDHPKSAVPSDPATSRASSSARSRTQMRPPSRYATFFPSDEISGSDGARNCVVRLNLRTCPGASSGASEPIASQVMPTPRSSPAAAGATQPVVLRRPLAATAGRLAGSTAAIPEVVHSRPASARSISMRASAMWCNRFRGARSRQRASRSRTRGGVFSGSNDQSGSTWRILESTSVTVSPANSVRPVRHS